MTRIATIAEVRQWREQARGEAIAVNIDPQEVDWLLRELGGVAPGQWHWRSPEDSLSLEVSLAALHTCWQERLRRRSPVQYLAGRAPWRQFTLKVSPAVLIPRPETELVIDILAAAVPMDQRGGDWADLGTGSGAIALGLADLMPQAIVHGVDVSAEALAIARENGRYYPFPNLRWHQGSWWEPLTPWRGRLQGMVSNPPYIPQGLMATLEPEVRDHEPHLALASGADGLTAIQYLIESAPTYLRSGGWWLVECMAGQAPTIAQSLQAQGGYQGIQIHADLTQRERFILAQCL